MFGQGDKAVADGQQQNPDQRGVKQRSAGRQFMAGGQQPSQQQHAGREKANSGHHQRRPAGDADGDGEIGRAPNDIQRKQRPDKR